MPARTGRPPDTGLSAGAIVTAAAELVDEEGLDALTMRRLADRLGSSAMSLYRHVATKDELLGLIVERHFAEIELPDTSSLPWREAVTAVLHAVHRALLTHPHLSEIVATRHVDAVSMFRATEALLRALDQAGLDERQAVDAVDVLTSYLLGYTQRKAELRRSSSADGSRLRRIRSLAPDEFGAVVAAAGRLVAQDVEPRLDAGLELILAGIEAQAAARDRPA